MPLYAIFRVSEKKYKDFKQLKHYEKHMEREIPVPNANMTIKNRRLIGSSDIVRDVRAYIEGIKIRKNGVIARDLLLTASPGFFEKASPEQKEAWVQLNIKWLQDNFKDNCVYATLHSDEKTWHISALIVPRFYDDKKKKYVLANARYFDGIAKMSAWQDRYAAAMQTVFNNLNRGIKYGKAKHVQIRQFYTLINKELDESELKSICAKAKNSEILEVKITQLQNTLNKYRGIMQKSEQERQEIRKENINLYKQVIEFKKDREIYNEAIKAMSEIYKIPKQHIVKILKYVENSLNPDKSKSRDGGKGLELSK